MEGKAKLGSLPDGDNAATYLGEDLDVRACLLDVGSPNEGHADLSQSLELGFGPEASELASVGIALDCGIERAEVALGARGVPVASVFHLVFDALCKQDEAGAGRKNGHAVLDALTERVQEPLLPEEPSLHRGFSSRQDQAVEGTLEVCLLPDLEEGLSELPQLLLMLDEGALERQHCCPHHLPRSAMRRSISSLLMPTMASPRSRER